MSTAGNPQLLFRQLTELLKQDERLVIRGKLSVEKLAERAQQPDPVLVKMLLSNAPFKDYFFEKAGDIWVFDKFKFQQFISTQPDCVLPVKIAGNEKAVLVWPFKNCILEGGPTKEEQNEIFCPEWLVTGKPADWFQPKVFSHFLKYQTGGATEVTSISNGDNLLIRGNNLPALCSLKNRYAGSIRLIYLDPPYNTESDAFSYSDHFSRSAWLTFMKNRLELAKDLMHPDGFVFIHISFHQFAYLKVLADEIFSDGHACTFHLLVRHPNRILKADKEVHDVMEYLLVYSKIKTNKLARRAEAFKTDAYRFGIEETAPGHTLHLNGQELTYFLPGEYRIIKCIPSASGLRKISIRGSLKEGNSSGRYYQKYLAPLQHQFEPLTLFKIPKIGNDQLGYRYFYTPGPGKSNGGYFQGVPANRQEFKEKPYPNFFDFVQAFNRVGYEGGVVFRNGKKPESLLQKVFELARIKPGDIVLDFFLGSGTTAAVAHKLGIQYIGIEQMDFGNNGPEHRLMAVINGEQSGISAAVGWKGGGSFIYCELEPLATVLSMPIKQATDSELQELLTLIIESAAPLFAWEEEMEESDFRGLSLNDKKAFLWSLLQRHPLYLNFSSIDHALLHIPANVQEINRQFYAGRIAASHLPESH